MNKRICYFNNEFVDFDKVKISPSDLGFLRGYGVFDAMRTFSGKPFLLDEHWNRLVNSASELNITVPISKEKFLKIIGKLLKKNELKDVSVRTVLTGGITDNGIAMTNNPTVLITIDDIDVFTPSRELFDRGASVITLNFKRFLPRAKTLNYIAAIKEQERKLKTNSQEIIYVNNGEVLEGATSNVFIVKDKRIITAKDNMLMGTVRNFVIKLAKENGYAVSERLVKIEELFGADEVFITGTYKWILPVTKVDGKIVSSGDVGKVTKKLTKLLNNSVRQ